ncbi:MAG: hypothetical protein K2J10_10060, partial [Muribaculaceae bacterium]|nr:hypothetical protein [Muribaculaceae bacterium]
FMKLSNRVKRNISFTLMLIGVSIIIARGWVVALEPSSGKAWFNLFSIFVLTYICFDRFRELQKRVKKGILFGSR